MKANVAVMRKLVHASYGVFKSDSTFDATKCFPAEIDAGKHLVAKTGSVSPRRTRWDSCWMLWRMDERSNPIG